MYNNIGIVFYQTKIYCCHCYLVDTTYINIDGNKDNGGEI